MQKHLKQILSGCIVLLLALGAGFTPPLAQNAGEMPGSASYINSRQASSNPASNTESSVSGIPDSGSPVFPPDSAVQSSVPAESSGVPASDAPAAPSLRSVAMPVSKLPSKMTAGYYANWSAYSGFTPEQIKASLIDVVHYAFAVIGSDYKVAVGAPDVDYGNFKKLAALKKANPGLITLISVGGWSDSSRFSDMALTDAGRRAFANSCVDFIRQYGFDGVDIDWEYPVSGGLSKGRPEDKTNFILLLKALREALNAQAKADGTYYYLTFAGGDSDSCVSHMQLSSAASYVDYAVDMTYDLHGPWDSYTDLNAPLTTPTGDSPQYKCSVDSSIRAWLGAGFPADKLVMGVPFYGYLYTGADSANNGLYQHFASAKAVGFDTITAGYLSNSSYSKQTSGQVPYLFGGGNFISYDDADSIAAKARYARSAGLRGMAAWELSFDRSCTLTSAVDRNFKG